MAATTPSSDITTPTLIGKHLRHRLERVGILYRTHLVQRGFSRRQVQHIYQGEMGALRLETLTALAQLFGISAGQLLTELETISQRSLPSPLPSVAALAPSPESSDAFLRETLQRQALDTLESFLRFWPTAAYAAQQNPTAPAVKLLPLVNPVMKLLEDWGVRAIAPVGEWVVFDPTLHQSSTAGIMPGIQVRVTHQGYVWGEPPRLLFRAQVVPGQNNTP